MIKRLFIICILTVMLFSGCTHKNENVILENNKTTDKSVLEKTVPEDPISEEDDSWKYEVAERLYEEFCYFYEHMLEDDPIDMEDRNNRAVAHRYNVVNNRIGYNRAMAADRANGVYVYKDYLSKDKVEYVLGKCDEVNDKLSWFHKLFYGYTDSGLHYMAIIYDFTTNSYYCQPLCDKVRGDMKESDFLNDMFLNSDFLVYDFYVEDLTEKRDTINMEVELVNTVDNKSVVVQKYYRLLLGGEGVLKKYNRELVPEGVTELRNKSWNLYAVKSGAYTQADDIYIYSYDKKTNLTQFAPIIK